MKNPVVEEVMIRGVYTLKQTHTLSDAVNLMYGKHIGAIVIVEEGGYVVGIITQYDIRILKQKHLDFSNVRIRDVMSKNPVCISKNTSIYRAAEIMNKRHIGHLCITNENKRLQGIVTYKLIQEYKKPTPPPIEPSPVYRENSSGIGKYIIGGLVLLFIIYLVLNFSENILTCSDGTTFGKCSSEKPLLCSFGGLTNKASTCSCPYGSVIAGDNCIDLSAVERKVHELVNIERQKNGLMPLNWDNELSKIARKHSQDMLKNNFFAHINLNGQDPTERGKLAGYYCHKDYGSYYTEGIAENIAYDWTYGMIWYTDGVETSREWRSSDEIAENAVNGWMNSPGHRKNILTSTYDKEGIGIAIGSDGKVLITQNFC